MKYKMITIKSNPQNIYVVENYLKSVVHEWNIGEDIYPDILISTSEAVNNAIHHGNNDDESKNVKIEMHKNKDHLIISVTDEGKGFDLLAIPNPTCKENIEKCGGRGVYIISALADKVSFINNGRTVQMRFCLHQS